VSGPASVDRRDPTKWFFVLIVGIAVVAVLIAMDRYL
jgi:hypothetical protein